MLVFYSFWKRICVLGRKRRRRWRWNEMDDSFCMNVLWLWLHSNDGKREWMRDFVLNRKAYLGVWCSVLWTPILHTLSPPISFPMNEEAKREEEEGKERVPLVKENNKAIEATTKMWLDAKKERRKRRRGRGNLFCVFFLFVLFEEKRKRKKKKKCRALPGIEPGPPVP